MGVRGRVLLSVAGVHRSLAGRRRNLGGGRPLSSRPTPIIDGFSDLVFIGRGGFSTVYSATQAGIERRVAIKVLDLGSSDLHRFERECRTLGTLSGVRGIVPVLQTAYTSSGQPCIVMQLMDGGSLAYRIKASGPLAPTDVIGNGIVLATALQAAHDARVFHRDIKPENVLFHGNDAAIADFGIAWVEGAESRSQTMDSISPPHAPPERFVDGRSDAVLGDVYSLGSTLFTALAGHPPFGTAADGGLAGLIGRVTHDPLPRIARNDIPPGLTAVLETATAKEPLARYQSMASFARALEAIDGADDAEDATVHRPATPHTVIRQAPPVPPPSTAVLPLASAVNPAPVSVSNTGPPYGYTGPPYGYTGPTSFTGPPDRSRNAAPLWIAASIMLALAVAGVAYLVGQGFGDESSADTTTVESTTSTSVEPRPTSAEETPTPEAQQPVQPPVTPNPTTQTTAEPTTTSTTLPEADATAAVDRYLTAASGHSGLDDFAGQWSYPIESHYGNPGVDEATLRSSAERYWSKYDSLEFERLNRTEVVSSAGGWETATPYRAVIAQTDGTRVCQDALIRLGFDRSWHVRTASEERIGGC